MHWDQAEELMRSLRCMSPDSSADFGRYSSALTINNGKSKNIRDAKWYDKSVPCRSACPADTDIPGYLEAIYNEDYNKAYKINLEDNSGVIRLLLIRLLLLRLLLVRLLLLRLWLFSNFISSYDNDEKKPNTASSENCLLAILNLY